MYPIKQMLDCVESLRMAAARLNECRSTGIVPRTDEDAKIIASAHNAHRLLFLHFDALRTDTAHYGEFPKHDGAVYPSLLKAFCGAMESLRLPHDRDGAAAAWVYVVSQAVALAEMSSATMTVRPLDDPPKWVGAPASPRRAPIEADVRRQTLSRDNNRCVECGSDSDLAIDHIYPWSKGGPDHPDNFQVLCRSCNSSKSATVPTVEAN